MVVCLALAAIMKYQVEQHRRCSFADRNWQRSRKELEIARLCVRDICTFAVLFWFIDLSLCRVWHQSVIFHTVFILCLGSYCKVCFIVSKYWLSSDKVWNILWPCFKLRLTTENHKPAGLCRLCVLQEGRRTFCQVCPWAFSGFPVLRFFSRCSSANWTPGRG